MEQHEDSGPFAPDQRVRRRWRAPAAATSVALVAAVCLYSGSAAHATTAPRLASVSAVSAQGQVRAAAAPNAGTAPIGGLHGAVKVYDGVGGGLEFWFNPGTGTLTVAVGAGIGAGASGVLGTYAPGTEPAPGSYLYASANLAAGSVVTTNVSGNYSLDNGTFSGSVSASVDGRTLTISSSGSTSMNVSLVAVPGAAGWTASTGVSYVFSFNAQDVMDYVWDAITNYFTGQYSLLVAGLAGSSSTSVYSDDSSTDGSVVSTSGSSASSDDGTSVSDDSSSSDDSGSSSDDSGGGGCGGVSDDGHAPIDTE